MHRFIISAAAASVLLVPCARAAIVSTSAFPVEALEVRGNGTLAFTLETTRCPDGTDVTGVEFVVSGSSVSLFLQALLVAEQGDAGNERFPVAVEFDDAVSTCVAGATIAVRNLSVR